MSVHCFAPRDRLRELIQVGTGFPIAPRVAELCGSLQFFHDGADRLVADLTATPKAPDHRKEREVVRKFNSGHSAILRVCVAPRTMIELPGVGNRVRQGDAA